MSSLLDRVKAKQRELDSKRLKDFSVTPPAGNSRWRILPHWTGNLDELPEHDFGQHFIKDPVSKEVRAVVVCAAKTYGQECEVCNQIATLKAEAIATGNEALADALNESRSAQKHLVNAVRWEKGTGYVDEVTVLALPMTAFEQLMGVVETYYAEGVNIFDPAGGHDIIIVRQGSGRNTTYTVMAAPTASAIDGKYLEKAQNLEDYVNQINEEKTRAAIAALGGVAAVGGLSTPTLALPKAVTAVAPTPAPVTTAAPVAAPVTTAAPAVATGATAVATPVADGLADLDLEDLDLGSISDADLADVL